MNILISPFVKLKDSSIIFKFAWIQNPAEKSEEFLNFWVRQWFQSLNRSQQEKITREKILLPELNDWYSHIFVDETNESSNSIVWVIEVRCTCGSFDWYYLDLSFDYLRGEIEFENLFIK